MSFRSNLFRAQARAWSCAIFSLACATLSFGDNSHAARTYRNPLLANRDMADPEVIQADGEYYLYPTSDGRGFEVFTSKDLVHWKAKGYAFKDPRGGAWAPD